MPQIYDRSDHARVRNTITLMRPLKGSLITVFPKIDPVSQSIVVIATHPQIMLSGQNIRDDGLVASMISEYKFFPRHDEWECLSVGLAEFAGRRDDADPLEKGPRGGAAFVDFLRNTLNGLPVTNSLRV